MKNKIYFLLALILLFTSCNKNKDAKTNLMGSSDELVKYAKGIYGDNVTIISSGDLNNNSNPDVLACIVNKKFDDKKYWIQKGSVIENEDSRFKELVKIDTKLSTPKGPLIDQVDAKSGYILRFLPAPKDRVFGLSISDSAGLPVSDELFLLWNKDSKSYDLLDNSDNIQ